MVSPGLDYAINRHYDPLQGRFTQVDPIGMSAADLSDPQSLNMYAYCGNDPINYVDPDGLFFKKLFRWIKKHWKVIVIVAAVVAVVALTVGFGWLGKALQQVAGWVTSNSWTVRACLKSPRQFDRLFL